MNNHLLLYDSRKAEYFFPSRHVWEIAVVSFSCELCHSLWYTLSADFKKPHGAQRRRRGSGGSSLLSCASQAEHLGEERRYWWRMAPDCSVLPAKKGRTPLNTNMHKRWLFLLVPQHLMEAFELDSCHVQNQASVSKLQSVEIFGLFKFSLPTDLMTSWQPQMAWGSLRGKTGDVFLVVGKMSCFAIFCYV